MLFGDVGVVTCPLGFTVSGGVKCGVDADFVLVVSLPVVSRRSCGVFVCTSRVALITFIVSRTTRFFTILLFARVWGVFFGMSKKSLLCEKRMCVFIINGPNSLVFLRKNGLVHIHTRRP